MKRWMLVLGAVELAAGLSGVMILTEDDLDLGDRTIHQLHAGASLDLGALRPGIQVRRPLDEDLEDVIDYTVGAYLSTAL